MINIKNISEIKKENILILGNFDAVHRGHVKIINEAKKYNNKLNKDIYVLLFNNDYKSKLKRSSYPQILSNNERVLRLKSFGIRKVFYLDFYEVKTLTAKKFINDIIKKIFNPIAVFAGNDYRYGFKAKGDIKLLKSELRKNGTDVLGIDLLSDKDKKISTEDIKQNLSLGNIKRANKLLGYQYFISGIVVKGNQLGRTIGFKTANIKNDVGRIIPKNGVYMTKTIYKDKEYFSMTNIGTRPTVENKKEIVIETNIFNFRKEIYGEELKVLFLKRIRDEKKFISIKELKNQLGDDKREIIKQVDKSNS